MKLGIAKVLLGSVGVLVAMLALAEVTLRAFPELAPPQWDIRDFHKESAPSYEALPKVPDPTLGFVELPNRRTQIQTRDFAYTYESDSRGFPNHGPWPEHADIVFLGDSVVEGEGVGIDQGFVNLVASSLPRMKVISLAMAAEGPERQYRVYRRYGRPLGPRLVIAGWYLASDISNDKTFGNWLKRPEGMDYEAHRFRSHEQENADPVAVLRRWKNESWVYGILREEYHQLRGKTREVQESYVFPNGDEILFEKKALDFATRTRPEDLQRIDAIFASFERLRAMVEQDGATLVVMLIPSKEELFSPDAVNGADSTVGRIRSRLKAAGVPVLDLYPVVRAASARGAPYFKHDIHFTPLGHRIVAEEILAWHEQFSGKPMGRHADARLRKAPARQASGG